jgi:Acyl-CoA dehydrogenase N terminal
MSLRSTLDFLMYDWLQAESLNRRPRFADHSRETFDAVFETCERTLTVKKSSCRRLRMMRKRHMPNLAC